ncbi:MAG: aminomethyl-transferring glycine dehydrogenase subunit GcvPA [Thermoprotei archaeon]
MIKDDERLKYYSDVPKELLFMQPLNIRAKSEIDVYNEIKSILKKNKDILSTPSFLGGGVWCHYVPPLVDYIASSPELLTSYTPYQPEISQGILQILYEYQSIICDLTGMDVANASMYNWATATAEAFLMSLRITGKHKVIIPRYMAPWRKRVIRTYLRPHKVEVIEYGINESDGLMNLDEINKSMSGAAALYVENPSFFGILDPNVEVAGKIAHEFGALYIVGVDPLTLGIIKPPGDYGADIVVGEGQHLGSPPSLGGPALGIIAVKDDMRLIRQLPGKIIGLTTSQDGSKRGFVMALQTREQHIRREKATSNITTNEALLAVRAAIYLSLLGSTGLKKLGELILERTVKLATMLSKIDGIISPLFNAHYFREFPINLPIDPSTVNSKLLEHGIIGGLDVKKFFPELGDVMLLATTELHNEMHYEMLVNSLSKIVGGLHK